MGIGGNGGWTSKLQPKNKARQQSRVDLILEQNSGKFEFVNSKSIRSRADEQSLTPTAPMLERWLLYIWYFIISIGKYNKH